ncbi:MAG TPA: hypothetical protein VMM93_07680 [Vicinamibacterales bacterium]|nr:hypothetical protein [Vicinamibacterales bacterium]
MSGLFKVLMVAVMVAETLALGQGSDVARILSDVRQALGGEATLASVKTVMIEGTRTRVMNEQSRSSAFEMAMELPSKFVRKEVAGSFNGIELTRATGFNGGELIERADAPLQMGHGVTVMRMGGPAPATPADAEAQRATQLAGARKDFARFTLGMFATGFEIFPLEFAYAGTAESGDTKAHVLTVTGPDQFEARLFVDSASHLPLMLTWMDREPLTMQAGGGPQVFRGGGSPADIEKMREQMQQQMREAEANRRTVEYRMFYADYKVFNGIKLPTRLQRMIDGNAAEELSFDKVRINGTLDAKLFNVK